MYIVGFPIKHMMMDGTSMAMTGLLILAEGDLALPLNGFTALC